MRSLDWCPASGAAPRSSANLEQSVFQRECRPARSARSAKRSCKGYTRAAARTPDRARRHAGVRPQSSKHSKTGRSISVWRKPESHIWPINGRLPESDRPLRNIRGVAVLNSSTVHLLVGPRSRARLDQRSERPSYRRRSCGHRQRRDLRAAVEPILPPMRSRTLGVAAGQTADTVLAWRARCGFHHIGHSTRRSRTRDTRRGAARARQRSTRWISSEAHIHFSDRR